MSAVNQSNPESSEAGPLLPPARFHAIILAAAIGLGFYLCWMMIRPFLAVITWAAALAIFANPLHSWLERRIRPNAAALVSLCLVVVVVVAPVLFITQQLYSELADALRAAPAELNSAALHAKIQQYPVLAGTVEWMETRLDLDAQIRAAQGAIAGKVSKWVSGSVWVFTEFIITFLTLFYFFRDWTRLLRSLRCFIPLSAPEIDQIFDRIATTVNTALYGNMLVKLVQGFLGGLMFWILGLPAPVLWGAAMALFAVLPVMGTAIVWVPAVIFLALSGSWVKAIVLAAWGALAVSLIDNFLYPLVVAGELRIHPLAAFFSIFGGLIAFGIAGVVLGPVILATTAALLEIWRIRTAQTAEG